MIQPLTLTNRSPQTCSVAGWPAVRRFNAAGQRIPTAIGREVYKRRGTTPFRVVRLGPGAAATFPALGGDWNHELDRGCRTAEKIQVEPRGGGGWLSAAPHPPDRGHGVPACRRWGLGPLEPGRKAAWPTVSLSEFYTPPTKHRPYYAGQMNGTKWRLVVRDSGDGRYCLKVFTDGSFRGRTCGRFYGPGVSGKLGFLLRRAGAQPAFVAGAVISKARSVAIRLSRGNPYYVQAMPPTRVLAPGISFFFTTVRHRGRPVSISGSTLDGRRVVVWKHA